jgi:hypothetical protein
MFAVTLVVMTMLLAYRKGSIWVKRPDYVEEQIWRTYIPDTVVPFIQGRVKYDFPLSMAPIVMMFMVPEPRLRSKYYWESYDPNVSAY